MSFSVPPVESDDFPIGFGLRSVKHHFWGAECLADESRRIIVLTRNRGKQCHLAVDVPFRIDEEDAAGYSLEDQRP
jgi:hypothetical protein